MTPAGFPGGYPYAPPGKYVLGTWCMGNYDDCPVNFFELNKAQSRHQLEKLFESFDQDLVQIFPDLEGHVQWKERYIAPFSLACMPGLVGKGRPTMQIPTVANLYLVSDNIREARGIPSQSAARAALTCVDRILSKQ